MYLFKLPVAQRPMNWVSVVYDYGGLEKYRIALIIPFNSFKVLFDGKCGGEYYMIEIILKKEFRDGGRPN